MIYTKINKYIFTLNEDYEIIEIEDFTTGEKKEEIINFKIGNNINDINNISEYFKTRNEAFYYNFVSNHEYLFFKNGYSGIQIDYFGSSGRKEYFHTNGKKNGICKIYDKDDNIVQEISYVDDNEIEYKENKNNKLFKHTINNNNNNYKTYYEYYDNGILKVQYNKTDLNKLVGSYYEYYDNGQIKIESNYDNNYRNGIFKKYYKSGLLSIETNFINNNKHGIYKNFYESGALKIIQNYTYGTQNGECIEYFNNFDNFNNNIYKKYTYYLDCLDGKYEEYYDNGNIRLICNYKYNKDITGNESGYKHGDIIEYYKSGKIHNKGKYINNKLIEYITFDEEGNIIKKI